MSLVDDSRCAKGMPTFNRRSLVLVLGVVIVVATASTSAVVYVLTRPPPPAISLTVMDGSAEGAIEGNLTTAGSNQTNLVLDFRATTYANQTNGSTSTLTLRLFTWTFFDSICGCVTVNVNADVVGRFASNLHPAGLELAVNMTGPYSSLQGWGPGTGTNVSFDPRQSVSFSASGRGALRATFVNETGKGSAYEFTYSEHFNIRARPQYNHFLGFRVTVDGPFTPHVSVGILLKVVNVPGGVWG